MNKKEKILTATIELLVVNARIDELKRSKTYLAGSTSTYFRNRLIALENNREKLEDVVNDTKTNESQEIRLVFNVPESLLSTKTEKKEDILQYLKKEFLVNC